MYYIVVAGETVYEARQSEISDRLCT